MDTATKPLLLTPNEAAKMLCISARTLWDLQKAGKVRAIRINRLVRYDPHDLIAYIEKQKKFSNYQI
jgi:excisionase family DNA binding protein